MLLGFSWVLAVNLRWLFYEIIDEDSRIGASITNLVIYKKENMEGFDLVLRCERGTATWISSKRGSTSSTIPQSTFS